MKRNDYERPTMMVVELQYRSHLLIVSGEQEKQLQTYEGEEWGE